MFAELLRAGALAVVCTAALAAQTPAGLPPEWEVQKQLTTLADHVQRVRPVLDQLKPQEWVAHGAPAAYQQQLDRTRSEIDYLIGSSKELAAKPEKLTVALETFFRMQTVESMLRSVASGVRKYQNPAVAELLESLIGSTNNDREQLRQYVVELAADREQQFKVVDQEAQRCRANLSRQPRTDGKHAGH